MRKNYRGSRTEGKAGGRGGSGRSHSPAGEACFACVRQALGLIPITTQCKPENLCLLTLVGDKCRLAFEFSLIY